MAIDWLPCSRRASCVSTREMLCTVRCVEACTEAMVLEISSVARAVSRASFLTSAATTAKPRPASPARAASIVAFSASRFVCAAMTEISLTTLPMRSDSRASSAMVCLACCVSLTLSRAAFEASCTWRRISLAVAESSSVAAATDETSEESVRATSVTLPMPAKDFSAEPASAWHEPSSRPAAPATEAITSCTKPSNSPASSTRRVPASQSSRLFSSIACEAPLITCADWRYEPGMPVSTTRR